MASLPIATLMDVALNPKVQAAVSQIFSKTYSNIFKRNEKDTFSAAIDVRPIAPEQQIILDRFAAIERQISNMPTDIEMAQAFSILQAELRTGQKRLWYTFAIFAFSNFVLLLLIYISVRSQIG